MDARQRKIKKFWKELHPAREPVKLKGLLNSWTAANSGDSWTHIYVFSGVDPETVERELERVIVLEGYGIEPAHDCSGQVFCHPARFYQFDDRIIVTQWYGRDV